MSHVLWRNDKNMSKSVTNSTTSDHAASGTILIWMAIVMPWPKLGPSSTSGYVVLLQPEALLISVAYGTTSGHRKAGSHSLGTGELVLPLYGPSMALGEPPPTPLSLAAPWELATPLTILKGELDHPGPHPEFWVGTLQYLSPLWPTILCAGTSPREP